MTEEFTGPTPEEIIEGILHAGKTGKQIAYAFGLINKGVKEGEIRTEIGCWDNVLGFFEMANRIYVKNEGMMLSDAELGIHQGSCKKPICKKLSKSYYEVLRPSQEEDSEKIAQYLKKLLGEILIGKPRPDLEGKESIYYDSQEGAELFVAKAVDITDKCISERRIKGMGERSVILSYVFYSGGILCDIKEEYAHSAMAQSFNINSNFSPSDETFQIRASIIGVDPELLHAIVLTNAPL